MGWYVEGLPFVIDDGFPEIGKWQSKATVNGKPGVDVNIGIIRNQFRNLCPPLLSHVQKTDTKDMLKTSYDDNKPISLVWSPLLSISIIITVSVNWTSPLLLLHQDSIRGVIPPVTVFSASKTKSHEKVIRGATLPLYVHQW